MKILTRIIQYFIAVILLATSIGKLLDIQGFALVIQSFYIFPVWMTASVGLAMSLFELGLSLWLFSGKWLRWAALTAAALHATFILWLLIAMARGLEITNCGCFGVFFARPLDAVTIIEDVVMVSLSGILYLLARKKFEKPTRIA